jgi:hypothetical protein
MALTEESGVRSGLHLQGQNFVEAAMEKFLVKWSPNAIIHPLRGQKAVSSANL